MKKNNYLLFLSAIVLAACNGQWNDLKHYELVAEITAFEIEGQESSSISSSEKTVTIIMPPETDLTRLAVSVFNYTERATVSPDIQQGTVLDLSAPVHLTLTTYDTYSWTISATAREKTQKPDDPVPVDPEEPKGELTADGPQLYNLSFDHWSHPVDELGNVNEYIYAPFGEGASEQEQAVWASNGDFTILLASDYIVSPEFEFLAAEGEGKAALKLKTLNILDQMASGSLFTGKANFTSLVPPIEAVWGVPFEGRPAALEGYVCYKPNTITGAKEPYEDEEGNTDKASILVILSDGDEPFTVKPPETLVDYNSDAVIGYGRILFDHEMEGYERFQLNLSYRNDRTPRYITIVTASSAYGDYLTGAEGSTLYLDELVLLYDK